MSNYNTTLQSNNADLQEVLQALQSKAAAGQATPVISVSSNGLITATAGTKSATKQLAFQAAKTITPSTASQIAVSSGYYTGGNITVAAVPTQSKTVTPTSTTQNITPDSGKFLSKVTVNGDSDLVAGNIKSGVNIFGVTGTYVGSGGGDTSTEDGLVTRSVTNYINNRVTKIGSYAFYQCPSLTSVSFPNVTSIGIQAFAQCKKLTSVSFPSAKSIGGYAFGNCSSLTSVSFPNVTSIEYSAFYQCSRLTTISFPNAQDIGSWAFGYCYSLTSASFPNVTTIGSSAFCRCSSLTSVSFPNATHINPYAFESCSGLTTVSFPKAVRIERCAFSKCTNLSQIYLTRSSIFICGLAASDAFSNTGIGSTKGSIFVPTSLVSTYKSSTNWAFFSNRIYGI